MEYKVGQKVVFFKDLEVIGIHPSKYGKVCTVYKTTGMGSFRGKDRIRVKLGELTYWVTADNIRPVRKMLKCLT